jgi:putative membrane protein
MWHPDSLGSAIITSAIFGLLGILLTVIGFKVFDWITPRINVEHELADKQNIAVAIVVAAMIIAVSIVIAAVVG